MARFRAWCPELGEVEDEAYELDGMDRREAAEVYAEEHLWRNGDPFKEIIVRVASTTTDRAWDVEVTVRTDPVFVAVRDVEIETEDGEEG
jgi:hypothetical protein